MSVGEKGKKLLLEAAERNNLTAVKYYIEEEEVTLFTINEFHETLVHIAAKNGNIDLIKYVLKKEPSIVTMRDDLGSSAFYFANAHGHTDIVKYLIEEHGDALTRENPRNFFPSAMHTAAEYGHLKTLKYFIEEKGRNVNTVDKRLESLLYTAVEYGHHPVVKYLVEEREADVTLKNINRANVLFPTIANDDLTLLKYFFDERHAPFDVNWQDKFGNTLVHRAAFMNRTTIMQYLVDEKHADINIAGHEKMTPLHYAASRNYHYICKFLIEHGANMSPLDKIGQTPVQKATDKTLIEYMKNATNANATRSRRSLCSTCLMYPSPISIHENNHPQQIVQDTDLNLSINQLDGSATTIFNNLQWSRVQSFIAVANMLMRNTWRWSNNGDIFLSPVSTLLERIDPLAEEAVTSVSYVEEE